MESELILLEQDKIFERAKTALAGELNEDIQSWDFVQMLKSLKALIKEKGSEQPGRGNNPVRFFCRHYLNMPGERYNEMRSWLAGREVMPKEKIELALRVLKTWQDGNLRQTIDKPALPSFDLEYPEGEISQPENLELSRKLVDHTISLFNSLRVLIEKSGISPKDVFGGDRMQITSAMWKICNIFGVDVIFPEPDPAQNQPVTKKDLANFGLQKFPERKRKI